MRVGSSPLTRGKLRFRGFRCPHAGFIPAHAGKTSLGCGATRRRRAHPRSHRENTTIKSGSGCITGSSPLTRGKHRRVETARAPRGLIPAHAGKTLRPKASPHRTRAHPRSRGENGSRQASPWTSSGSSPLTRGKLHVCSPSVCWFGLIPAHAGKTTIHSRLPIGCRAHPRSRGENCRNVLVATHRPGSSPLTRGKLIIRRWARTVWGLIPAHAGKTSSRERATASTWAHPRSRGENDLIRVAGYLSVGSSPLTRGKLMGMVH